MTGRALARLLGLLVLWSGVELLERVAYAAGAAAVVDEDLADELEPADVSDVVWLHVVTFHGPEAPRAGECAC